MKNFLLAVAVFSALLISGLPVSAGLGAATSKTKSSSYDAWCGEKGNDCKIRFYRGRLIVNEYDSVDFDDITFITRNVSHGFWKGQYTITLGIEYQEKEMEEPEFAEIIFGNLDVADKFWRDLRRACRNCKDVDSAQVDITIKD